MQKPYQSPVTKVYPISINGGRLTVPPSKPETQRAIWMASLADGRSRISGDLRASEIQSMITAWQNIGAEITQEGDATLINGISDGFPESYRTLQIIDAKGSALVARTLSAVSAATGIPMIITGDRVLRSRVMKPLFEILDYEGEISFLAEPSHLPIVVKSRCFRGGDIRIPGDISSQFITSLLLAGSLYSRNRTRISVEGNQYSTSYVRQTIDMMGRFGVIVTTNDDCTELMIHKQTYKPLDIEIEGDFTSASYLIQLALLFPGIYTLDNLNESSIQGEKKIVSIAREMGIKCEFEGNSLVINNSLDVIKGNYQFDVSDSPNIVPTLAAMAAFVDGTVKVTGARLTRLHKSSRVEAMLQELSKIGVRSELVVKDDVIDGFVIHGSPSNVGDVTFDSHGDHRNYMALFIASLKMTEPSTISGAPGVENSFPGFFQQLQDCLGVRMEWQN